MNINELKDKREKLIEIERRSKLLKKSVHDKYVNNALTALFIWAPTMIWTGAYLYSSISRNKYPGHLDYVTKTAYTTTKYSSITGEIECEKEYAYKKNVKEDVIFYYEPWVKNEDGTYSSNTEKYVLNDITDSQIKRLLTKEDLSFEDLTILSVQSQETIKNDKKETITQADLEPHYEIIVNDVNSSDTIIDRETRKDDLSEDWVLLGAILAVEGLIEPFMHLAAYEDRKHPYKSAKDENECLQFLKTKKKVLGKIK